MPQDEMVGLVGDIGGTNARFAIARSTGGTVTLENVLTLPGRDYATLEAAARDYLTRSHVQRLDGAVAACAGAVVDGSVSFTNLPWTTSERSLGAAVGLPAVHLINDLEAVAWAAPALNPAGLRRIAHTGTLPTPPPPLALKGRGTRAILNAGTGTNASAFVHNDSGSAVVVGEYGHASFAPVNSKEIEIWRALQAQFGRVSIERVLCGPGLLNLYRAICSVEGVKPMADAPSAVNQEAAASAGPARRAVAQFCAIMGSVAGDVALAFGARGGVYLAGGVAAHVMSGEYDTAFRFRFEDKGRFQTYMADIPTLLITDGNVALLGAGRAMAARGRVTAGVAAGGA